MGWNCSPRHDYSYPSDGFIGLNSADNFLDQMVALVPIAGLTYSTNEKNAV